MNTPMTEPLFIYSWQHTSSVNERLAIYPDGSIWLWSLHPGLAQPIGYAGTFMLPVSVKRSEQMTRLAEQLWYMPASEIALDRYNDQYRLTVNYQQQQRAFVLPPGESGLTDARTAAAQFGRDLRAQAEAQPLAIIKIGLKTAAAASGGFFVTLENTGTAPVSVFLGSGQVTLVDGQGATHWQGPVMNNSMGLISTAGDLLDGLYASAVIQPQSTAKAYIKTGGPIALDAASAVRLEGQIELPSPAGFPLYVQPTPAEFAIRSQTV